MYRKDVISRAAVILRQAGAKKLVKLPKHVFHISDDDGNEKDFIVKGSEKAKLYTVEDIEVILDALITAICESLAVGEDVSIRGFGKFWPKYRSPRGSWMIGINDYITVPAKFTPSFTPGNDLKLAVSRYQSALEERGLFPLKDPSKKRPSLKEDD